jgi:predicted nuclease of predicted toxin-antitoxin system
VRLLLDEHYSPVLAEQLRAAGHDVVSVQEREDLRSLGDWQLLMKAASEGRAVMTEDAKDFIPLAREAAAAGERHFGMILTSSRSLSRRKRAAGDVIERLDEFLADHPADDALADQVAWFSPTSD